jgi:hypothetical protein
MGAVNTGSGLAVVFIRPVHACLCERYAGHRLWDQDGRFFFLPPIILAEWLQQNTGIPVGSGILSSIFRTSLGVIKPEGIGVARFPFLFKIE